MKVASTAIKALRSSACPVTALLPTGTRSLHRAMDILIPLLHAMASVFKVLKVLSSYIITPYKLPCRETRGLNGPVPGAGSAFFPGTLARSFKQSVCVAYTSCTGRG